MVMGVASLATTSLLARFSKANKLEQPLRYEKKLGGEDVWYLGK
ncbi:5686_t:CDS:2 [Ambispora gerdemannii]|uniref:5686_t:CDS:1 n=1 Tax=Ambispora gerdemannii TaxID=144530 RepID=A0A9N8WM38_9GLOM|nr:5686_t:CDS:2 [Ambispora gerdemannii]